MDNAQNNIFKQMSINLIEILNLKKYVTIFCKAHYLYRAGVGRL
jgi:hypothetical protein